VKFGAGVSGSIGVPPVRTRKRTAWKAMLPEPSAVGFAGMSGFE
jgi:NAD-dependent SIR2 family protein deacetylase